MVALAKAKLCMNCEYISDATKETCPHCGEFANWLSVSNALSGKREVTVYDRSTAKLVLHAAVLAS